MHVTAMNMPRFIFILPMITLSPARAAGETPPSPPAVTAKAWAVADAKSGEVLWSKKADERRKSASTTKMMCAWAVLQLAEKNADILNERVTFSALSGATNGSGAGIKAGESLPVRDCLHGLLLPSGNDAGNALAEHFHARLAPPDAGMLKKAGLDDPKLSTRVNFIAEMNRHARAIGMKDTVYRSSFGDGGTEKDRTTTACDLVRLAQVTMQSAAFRKIVATQHYECEVRLADGGTRTAKWDNTNKLLALDSAYDGIKTGMTKQAGNCLVASGHRGGDHLFVVVLGCSTEDSRFDDAQKLFRWAWAQRQTR